VSLPASDSDVSGELVIGVQAEEWLTVKQFAARVGMSEHGVREAIRKRTLAYHVERLTTGPKAPIRIVFPRPAA
jgi:hypothetical protein